MKPKDPLTEHLLVTAYKELVRRSLELGFTPLILTYECLPFRSETVTLEQMGWSIERSYTILLTRFIREPRRLDTSALPLMIAMPDLPLIKWRKVKRLASINGGLHAHAFYLLPPKLRNGVEPQDVFTKANKRLCTECRLTSFDASPLAFTPERVVGYVLKSLTIKRFDDSTIWLYPKATSELSKLVRGANPTRRTQQPVAVPK